MDFPEDIFYLNEWQKLNGMAFLASRETRIQSLQFKIIHRIIPCRDFFCLREKLLIHQKVGFVEPLIVLVHFCIACTTIGKFLRIKNP